MSVVINDKSGGISHGDSHSADFDNEGRQNFYPSLVKRVAQYSFTALSFTKTHVIQEKYRFYRYLKKSPHYHPCLDLFQRAVHFLNLHHWGEIQENSKPTQADADPAAPFTESLNGLKKIVLENEEKVAEVSILHDLTRLKKLSLFNHAEQNFADGFSLNAFKILFNQKMNRGSDLPDVMKYINGLLLDDPSSTFLSEPLQKVKEAEERNQKSQHIIDKHQKKISRKKLNPKTMQREANHELMDLAKELSSEASSLSSDGSSLVYFVGASPGSARSSSIRSLTRSFNLPNGVKDVLLGGDCDEIVDDLFAKIKQSGTRELKTFADTKQNFEQVSKRLTERLKKHMSPESWKMFSVNVEKDIEEYFVEASSSTFGRDRGEKIFQAWKAQGLEDLLKKTIKKHLKELTSNLSNFVEDQQTAFTDQLPYIAKSLLGPLGLSGSQQNAWIELEKQEDGTYTLKVYANEAALEHHPKIPSDEGTKRQVPLIFSGLTAGQLNEKFFFKILSYQAWPQWGIVSSYSLEDFYHELKRLFGSPSQKLSKCVMLVSPDAFSDNSPMAVLQMFLQSHSPSDCKDVLYKIRLSALKDFWAQGKKDPEILSKDPSFFLTLTKAADTLALEAVDLYKQKAMSIDDFIAIYATVYEAKEAYAENQKKNQLKNRRTTPSIIPCEVQQCARSLFGTGEVFPELREVVIDVFGPEMKEYLDELSEEFLPSLKKEEIAFENKDTSVNEKRSPFSLSYLKAEVQEIRSMRCSPLHIVRLSGKLLDCVYKTTSLYLSTTLMSQFLLTAIPGIGALGFLTVRAIAFLSVTYGPDVLTTLLPKTLCQDISAVYGIFKEIQGYLHHRLKLLLTKILFDALVGEEAIQEVHDFIKHRVREKFLHEGTISYRLEKTGHHSISIKRPSTVPGRKKVPNRSDHSFDTDLSKIEIETSFQEISPEKLLETLDSFLSTVDWYSREGPGAINIEDIDESNDEDKKKLAVYVSYQIHQFFLKIPIPSKETKDFWGRVENPRSVLEKIHQLIKLNGQCFNNRGNQRYLQQESIEQVSTYYSAYVIADYLAKQIDPDFKDFRINGHDFALWATTSISMGSFLDPKVNQRMNDIGRYFHCDFHKHYTKREIRRNRKPCLFEYIRLEGFNKKLTIFNKKFAEASCRNNDFTFTDYPSEFTSERRYIELQLKEPSGDVKEEEDPEVVAKALRFEQCSRGFQGRPLEGDLHSKAGEEHLHLLSMVRNIHLLSVSQLQTKPCKFESEFLEKGFRLTPVEFEEENTESSFFQRLDRLEKKVMPYVKKMQRACPSLLGGEDERLFESNFGPIVNDPLSFHKFVPARSSDHFSDDEKEGGYNKPFCYQSLFTPLYMHPRNRELPDIIQKSLKDGTAGKHLKELSQQLSKIIELTPHDKALQITRALSCFSANTHLFESKEARFLLESLLLNSGALRTAIENHPKVIKDIALFFSCTLEKVEDEISLTDKLHLIQIGIRVQKQCKACTLENQQSAFQESFPKFREILLDLNQSTKVAPSQENKRISKIILHILGELYYAVDSENEPPSVRKQALLDLSLLFFSNSEVSYEDGTTSDPLQDRIKSRLIWRYLPLIKESMNKDPGLRKAILKALLENRGVPNASLPKGKCTGSFPNYSYGDFTFSLAINPKETSQRKTDVVRRKLVSLFGESENPRQLVELSPHHFSCDEKHIDASFTDDDVNSLVIHRIIQGKKYRLVSQREIGFFPGIEAGDSLWLEENPEGPTVQFLQMDGDKMIRRLIFQKPKEGGDALQSISEVVEFCGEDVVKIDADLSEHHLHLLDYFRDFSSIQVYASKEDPSLIRFIHFKDVDLIFRVEKTGGKLIAVSQNVAPGFFIAEHQKIPQLIPFPKYLLLENKQKERQVILNPPGLSAMMVNYMAKHLLNLSSSPLIMQWMSSLANGKKSDKTYLYHLDASGNLQSSDPEAMAYLLIYQHTENNRSASERCLRSLEEMSRNVSFSKETFELFDQLTYPLLLSEKSQSAEISLRLEALRQQNSLIFQHDFDTAPVIANPVAMDPSKLFKDPSFPRWISLQRHLSAYRKRINGGSPPVLTDAQELFILDSIRSMSKKFLDSTIDNLSESLAQMKHFLPIDTIKEGALMLPCLALRYRVLCGKHDVQPYEKRGVSSLLRPLIEDSVDNAVQGSARSSRSTAEDLFAHFSKMYANPFYQKRSDGDGLLPMVRCSDYFSRHFFHISPGRIFTPFEDAPTKVEDILFEDFGKHFLTYYRFLKNSKPRVCEENEEKSALFEQKRKEFLEVISQWQGNPFSMGRVPKCVEVLKMLSENPEAYPSANAVEMAIVKQEKEFLLEKVKKVISDLVKRKEEIEALLLEDSKAVEGRLPDADQLDAALPEARTITHRGENKQRLSLLMEIKSQLSAITETFDRSLREWSLAEEERVLKKKDSAFSFIGESTETIMSVEEVGNGIFEIAQKSYSYKHLRAKLSPLLLPGLISMAPSKSELFFSTANHLSKHMLKFCCHSPEVLGVIAPVVDSARPALAKAMMLRKVISVARPVVKKGRRVASRLRKEADVIAKAKQDRRNKISDATTVLPENLQSAGVD